jgi:AsmA protein
MAAPRSLARKLSLAAALVAGGVVVFVAILVLLVDSGAVSRRVADLVLPRVSRALGRDVTLKDARLSVLPSPRVSLSGLTVAGRPGEPPLVEAESLDVELSLWPLLASLGKEVDVRSIVLVRPTVNLVRAPDGTWNTDGLGGPKEPASPPPSGGEGPATTRVAVRSVSVEKAAFRMLDRGASAPPGVAVKDLDLVASGLGAGLSPYARIAAAVGADTQDVHAELSIARLPEELPQRPEDWPAVQGTLHVGALALERLRGLLPGALAAIVRGGKVSLDARVATEERTYRVDGSGEVKDLLLRGQPASGHFRAAARLPAGHLGAAKAELLELALRGPGVDLGGHASVELSPLRAWFVVTGPLLDLDAVMGLLPPGEQDAQPSPKGGPLLPDSVRKEVEAAQVRGTVAVGTLRSGRLQATDVRGQVRLVGGTLEVEKLEAAVFGGRVSADGSRVGLASAEPTWRLAARLGGVELGEATKAFSGASPVLGKLDGTLDVAGTGTDWPKVRQAVNGLAQLALQDGALTTTDMGDTILGAVSTGLRALGKGGAGGKVARAQGGKTELQDLAGSFTVKDGFLAARSPLTFSAPFGGVSLGGRIGLDGRLDLTGTTAVPKSALAGLAGGLPLPQTLSVPLGVRGTLERPALAVNADAAVASLAKGGVKQATQEVRGKAERAGRRAIGDVLKGMGGRK